MKKLIIIALLLVSVSPFNVSAQVVTTQEDVNQQLLVMINSLMAQVQDLMAKLISMQTEQSNTNQTLGSIQQTISTPSSVTYGKSSVNKSSLPLTIGQKVTNKFDEKYSMCSSLIVKPNDKSIVDWLVGKTDEEKNGYYQSSTLIENMIRNNYDSSFREEKTNTNFCKFTDARNNGCEFNVAIQQPYISCMLAE